MLITGGAGFIGTNLAARLAEAGRNVLLLDNLSRPGVERNLQWLLENFPKRITFESGDVRDRVAVNRAVAGAGWVYHLAAQVAVTTSLDDPVHDFETNARGTLSLLEACRRQRTPPALLFTSTNKVYGELDDVPLRVQGNRYAPRDETTAVHGVDESRPLAFHSPYGCSKGTADQYVLDYARCYQLPAVVFRMSCIYGPHQCGTEDQGWVAHFVRQVLHEAPIVFYGDGRQVRDLLFVEDLVSAMRLTLEQIDATRGRVFNMGGGPNNAGSLWEVVQLIDGLHSPPPTIHYAPWRQGDQKYYVSDTRAFRAVTGWEPRVALADGIGRLYRWLAHAEALPITDYIK